MNPGSLYDFGLFYGYGVCYGGNYDCDGVYHAQGVKQGNLEVLVPDSSTSTTASFHYLLSNFGVIEDSCLDCEIGVDEITYDPGYVTAIFTRPCS